MKMDDAFTSRFNSSVKIRRGIRFIDSPNKLKK